MLSTPYYRLLTETHVLGDDEEPDQNYGPYDFFCMETRLYPIIYSVLNRDTVIQFKSVLENGRMAIKIYLVEIQNAKGYEPVPNKDVVLTKRQETVLNNAVSNILSKTPKYCLINTKELYIASRKEYPRGWFETVLGYVPLGSEYNPFIREEGIYLSFNPHSDYKTAYNEVCKNILDTLESYYREGVVYGASNIAVPWRLERLDHEEVRSQLYRPLWSDRRFAPNPVEFLLGKIKGNKFIEIEVSDNLTKRHFIASALSQEKISMIFSGKHIRIPANSLDSAQYLTALVKRSEGIAEGKALTHSVNRLDLVYKYIDAANKLLGNPDCTGYQDSDPYKPYVFSCLIPLNLSINAVLNQLTNMVNEAQLEKK